MRDLAPRARVIWSLPVADSHPACYQPIALSINTQGCGKDSPQARVGDRVSLLPAEHSVGRHLCPQMQPPSSHTLYRARSIFWSSPLTWQTTSTTRMCSAAGSTIYRRARPAPSSSPSSHNAIGSARHEPRQMVRTLQVAWLQAAGQRRRVPGPPLTTLLRCCSVRRQYRWPGCGAPSIGIRWSSQRERCGCAYSPRCSASARSADGDSHPRV